MKKDNVIKLFGDNIVPKKGVKYSKLLEKFINPFISDFKDTEEIDYILDFAVNAWNMANINIIIPNENIEEGINAIIEKDEVPLLKKMLTYKEKKFKEFTHFIVAFELKETPPGEDPILSVVTQEQDDYFANMVRKIEEEDGNKYDEEDSEENYIDRSAIILKPQQPFLDWYNKLDEEDRYSSVDEHKKTNIYLVDDDIDDVEKWLRKKFDKFFMLELDEWCIDKKKWPKKRNYKMFKEWFQIDISASIYDMEKKPVLKF